jgi:hypothetical protein
VNYILYNRLTDNAGTGSYELDLPNGGFADVIGNIIQQSAASQNSTILAYGEEGLVNPHSELNVINNTFVNDRGNGIFISAARLPAEFKLKAMNNIFAGPGETIRMNADRPITGANLVTTIAAAGFVDPAKYDYHLAIGSPAIGKGIDPRSDGLGQSLFPIAQYTDPVGVEPRPAAELIDAGAFAIGRHRRP